MEFVLGKIDRRVDTRVASTQAPVTFEIPRPVIVEAVVNAVTHRNYRHNGFVQVIVFADRVEVWNPGELPPGLTPALLREPHGPIPRNPLIAEPLFRVKYVEKAGTGTTDMIADCREAGLPEPDFEQRGPHFVVTLLRDWLTADVVSMLALNERQLRVLPLLKTQRKITIGGYMNFVNCPRRTAGHDLDEFIAKGILRRVGRGRGTHYELVKKYANNVPNVPKWHPTRNWAQTGQTGH